MSVDRFLHKPLVSQVFYELVRLKLALTPAAEAYTLPCKGLGPGVFLPVVRRMAPLLGTTVLASQFTAGSPTAKAHSHQLFQSLFC